MIVSDQNAAETRPRARAKPRGKQRPGGRNLSIQLIKTLYAQAPHATLHAPYCKTKHLLKDCQFLVSTDGQRLSAAVAYSEDSIEFTWSLAGRSETLRNLIAQVRRRLERVTFLPVMETGSRSWGQMLGLPVTGRYFRAFLPEPNKPAHTMPPGFEIIPLDPREHSVAASRLINEAYPSLPRLTKPEALVRMTETEHYFPDGWFFLLHQPTGSRVGLAISGYDPEMEEGFIDWVQVAPRFRHRGLGISLTSEAIRRLSDRARLITASGSLEAPFTLGDLFRECGLDQMRQWSILGQDSPTRPSPFIVPPDWPDQT